MCTFFSVNIISYNSLKEIGFLMTSLLKKMETSNCSYKLFFQFDTQTIHTYIKLKQKIGSRKYDYMHTSHDLQKLLSGSDISESSFLMNAETEGEHDGLSLFDERFIDTNGSRQTTVFTEIGFGMATNMQNENLLCWGFSCSGNDQEGTDLNLCDASCFE